MPLPRPAAVIFDMDGTTVRHLNPRMLHALEIADDVMFRTRMTITKIARMLGYGVLYRTRRSTRKPRLVVHRILHKVRRKSVEQIVEPCPGIIDLLELLRTNNIPAGLVSNGLGKGYGHDILEKFELVSLFRACIFREDIIKSKPDPEAIVTILNRLDIGGNSDDCIWYVGDRAKDVVAAVSAMPHIRARIVPIGYGLHVIPSLFKQKLGADHLVLSYEDWYPVVEDILNKPRVTQAS